MNELKEERKKLREALYLRIDQVTRNSDLNEIAQKVIALNNYLDDKDTKLENVLDTISNVFTTNQKSRIKKVIDDINERKNEVENLYGLIGKNSTAGNYKRYASDETPIIWRLYILAFLLMFLVSLLLAYCLWNDFNMNHSIRWFDLLARLPITFVLYAPALYLAMEAKKRHNRQIELQDFEMKISSIDPYLKNIDFVESRRVLENPDKLSARDVKLELAKDLFSTNKKSLKNDNLIIPKEFIEFMEQLSKICNWSNCDSKDSKTKD